MEEIIYGYGGKKYTVEKLKDLCPSSSEIEDQNKIERETHRLKIYHSERYNSQVENLPGDIGNLQNKTLTNLTNAFFEI